jgi:hypothetical protein
MSLRASAHTPLWAALVVLTLLAVLAAVVWLVQRRQIYFPDR